MTLFKSEWQLQAVFGGSLCNPVNNIFFCIPQSTWFLKKGKAYLSTFIFPPGFWFYSTKLLNDLRVNYSAQKSSLHFPCPESSFSKSATPISQARPLPNLGLGPVAAVVGNPLRGDECRGVIAVWTWMNLLPTAFFVVSWHFFLFQSNGFNPQSPCTIQKNVEFLEMYELYFLILCALVAYKFPIGIFLAVFREIVSPTKVFFKQ